MKRPGRRTRAAVNRVDGAVQQWFTGQTDLHNAGLVWDLGSRGGDLLPVLLLLWEARKPRGWRVGVAILVQALVVNLLVKNLVRRPRPRPHGRTSSFPSGHAATAAAVAVGLGGRNPVRTAAIVSGAAVTGVSRLGKGVHWLSDVVVGTVIGVAVGFAIRKLPATGRTRNS